MKSGAYDSIIEAMDLEGLDQAVDRALSIAAPGTVNS